MNKNIEKKIKLYSVKVIYSKDKKEASKFSNLGRWFTKERNQLNIRKLHHNIKL